MLCTGYQYQLRYRKKDSGGFAIWQHSEASTWLSSFVLRTMCCARKFIQVDPNVVSGLINFLGTRQNASGKILEPRTVFSREMLVSTYATCYSRVGCLNLLNFREVFRRMVCQ